MRIPIGAAVATLAMAAGGASAAKTLFIDINGLHGSASEYDPDDNPFAKGVYTGTLSVHDSFSGTLNSIEDDAGTHLFGPADNTNFDFWMDVHFVAGVVTGGSLTLGEVGFTGNSYTADLLSGEITTLGNVEGLTFNGFFAGNSFFGIDVTDWNNNEPLSGTFLNLKFNPDPNGNDAATDVDFSVSVPMPAPALMAGAGLLAVGIRRRR